MDVTTNLEDTMQPTKPEDYEVAIPIDKKVLKAEIEKMIEGTQPILDEPGWMTMALSKPKEPPKTVKCTCAKQFYTKKRNKKKGLIVMRRQSNGYTNRGCPVHFHK